MIIASKGHVSMKGKGIDVISEFVTIACALLDFKDISPDMLKAAVDYAYREKKGEDNEQTSN